MQAPYFYIASNFAENELLLPEEESKHATRVLRLSIGDNLILVNGIGKKAITTISSIEGKKCLVAINEVIEEPERAFKIHIAVAPTKNTDRMEWFVEKATEAGIDEISFLHCKHSERSVLKTERIKAVAISAMKQSEKARMPIVNELTSFKSFITATNNTNKGIAHCKESEKITLKNWIKPNENYTVLIGPEGDFTNEEIEFALQNGFKEISLGKERLRTETAALYSCFAINLLNS